MGVGVGVPGKDLPHERRTVPSWKGEHSISSSPLPKITLPNPTLRGTSLTLRKYELSLHTS